MEGPRLKRSRLENSQRVQDAKLDTLVDLTDQDDDIVFISSNGNGNSNSNSNGNGNGNTTITTRLTPSNRKPLSVPTTSRKLTPPPKQTLSSGKKNSFQSKLGKRKPINQSTNAACVQTSLTDFFRSKNPKPQVASIYESAEVSVDSTEVSVESGFFESLKPESDQSVNQSMELFTTAEETVAVLHERAVDEAIKFLDEDDDSTDQVKQEYPGEDDDSSGDEFLSNLPENALVDSALTAPPTGLLSAVGTTLPTGLLKTVGAAPSAGLPNTVGTVFPTGLVRSVLTAPSTSFPAHLPLATLQQKVLQRQPPSLGAFRNKSGRNCPFYKIMPGTLFSVDAFSFGYIPNVQSYFLSHFHSDHYTGMTNKFQRPIYCSRITANLVKRKIKVDEFWVKEIPMNTPYVVDGVELTLLDANHCPGSCLFLFKLRDGRVYLHTGDFRADPEVLGKDPALQNLREISKLYLDTTYLDPYYDFESQAATVEIAAEFALQTVAKNPKTLIVCGTYSVGKEKIFMRIAEVLKSKVAMTAYKMEMMECFEWPNLAGMLTKDWQSAQVHVLPMNALNVASLNDHLEKFPKFERILGIIPSGWQFDKKQLSLRNIKAKVVGSVSLLGLPYSEHSSFRELEWFVRFIKPKEVIPTVNVGNPKRRKEMEKILKSWLDPNFKPAVVKKQNLITGFFQS